MKLATLFLSALLVLGLTGCGSPPAGGEGAESRIYNTLSNAEIKGFDPVSSNDLYSHRLVCEFYEGLMQWSYLERPYKAEPALADGMPTVSPDGLTWTFKLKKGVLFHDNKCFPGGKGREFVADDVIYSWKRLANSKASAGEGWWIFEEKIEGLDEFRAYTATVTKEEDVDYSKPVAGLTAPDKHTLVVKLKKPYPVFPYVLTMGFARVVPHEAVKAYGKEFLNNPVGTGPYMLASSGDWIPNSKVVLTRNPAFRQEVYPSTGEPEDATQGLLKDAGQKVPFIDKVVVHIIIEGQPAWLKFMQGDLDAIAPPKDNYSTALPMGKLSPEMQQMGVRHVRTPSLDVTYTAFNMDDPVVGTPAGAKGLAIRRAVSLGLDRTKMIDLFYNGRAIPAKGPIPPGLAGYDPEWVNEWSTYDPEKAKKVLADAGYPNGEGVPTLVYENTSSTTSAQLAEFLKKGLEAIGIKMDVNTSSWPAFEGKVRKKQAQFFGMAWQADYPDAENFLMLFTTARESPGPNGANYKNPEFDKLYDQISVMPDSPERTEIYKRMVRMLADDLPWAFDLHRVTEALVHEWLTNYKPFEAGHGFYKYYKIDPAKRATRKAAFRR